MQKLIKNPSDDSKYTIRVLKERDKSRNSGDSLAQDIIKILESGFPTEKKLLKALRKYSESEGWNPGLFFVEKYDQ